MPANSGAITGTKAHKHSALSADGGFLDENVTGVSGTANGSLLYFDAGSVAQNLPSGNLNDVLTMGAAVPAWTPPAGGGGSVNLVASQELAVAASEINLTYAPLSFADYSAIEFYWSAHQTAGNDFRFHFNGIGANYTYQWTRVTGGAQSAGQIVAGTEIYTQPNDDIGSGHVRIICQDPSTSAGANQLMMYEGEMVGFSTDTYFKFGGYIASTTITSNDAVRLYVPAGNISVGGVLSVYSVSR